MMTKEQKLQMQLERMKGRYEYERDKSGAVRGWL